MSASQRTTNMQLPLFVDSDKFERTDWNSAMNAIDGAVGSQLINIYPQQFLSTGGNNIAEQCNNMYQQIITELARLEGIYGQNKVLCEISMHTGLSYGYLRSCDPIIPWKPLPNSSIALSGVASNQRHILHFSGGQVDYYQVGTSYVDQPNNIVERSTEQVSGVRGAQVVWYVYR